MTYFTVISRPCDVQNFGPKTAGIPGQVFLMSSWRPWAYGPWTPRPYELVIKVESRASSARLTSSGSSRQQLRPQVPFMVSKFRSRSLQLLRRFLAYIVGYGYSFNFVRALFHGRRPDQPSSSSLARRVLRPKFYFFEYSFLEYALTDTLKYAKAPGPHCGAEGRWRRCRIAGLAFYERAVHQMPSLCFPAQCTRRGAPGMTFLLPVGRYVWPPSVRADSCRSDGRAIAAWHKRGHGHAREGR